MPLRRGNRIGNQTIEGAERTKEGHVHVLMSSHSQLLPIQAISTCSFLFAYSSLRRALPVPLDPSKVLS